MNTIEQLQNVPVFIQVIATVLIVAFVGVWKIVSFLDSRDEKTEKAYNENIALLKKEFADYKTMMNLERDEFRTTMEEERQEDKRRIVACINHLTAAVRLTDQLPEAGLRLQILHELRAAEEALR